MNRILAVMIKQSKDTLKNKAVLLQFILFPLITYFFTEFVGKAENELPIDYFVTMYSTMYVGMVPLVTLASIIAEDREKKSLRMLIMSNVKPIEYLAGVVGYVMILCILGSFAFAMIGGYTGMELIKFILIMVIGSLASSLLGSAVGIVSKNQSSATGLSTPIALICAFIPMVAMFNESFEKIANLLYTQQLGYLMDDLSTSGFAMNRLLIIIANMLLFLVVFIIVYRKTDLKD